MTSVLEMCHHVMFPSTGLLHAGCLAYSPAARATSAETERGSNWCILFYAILFYSILFSSLLFYSILFHVKNNRNLNVLKYQITNTCIMSCFYLFCSIQFYLIFLFYSLL